MRGSKKIIALAALAVVISIASGLLFYFNTNDHQAADDDNNTDVIDTDDEPPCDGDCEVPSDGSETPPDNSPATTYIVQAGDTLYSIAKKFGTTWQFLQAINSISDPNMIYVGQVLKLTGEVPTPTPPQDEPTITPAEISRGDTSKNQVIFTFDGGSGTQSLASILSVLDKHDITGTFFITGKWAEANPSGLRSIADAGHEIYNHTYSHPDLTTISNQAIADELSKANDIISDITGKTTKPYFRPPYGARNQTVWDAAWINGYQSVYWTVDALDWKTDSTAEYVKNRILSNINPGTIFLMHIGDDITGQILDEIFTEIETRGYKIVSLSQGL